MCVCVCVCVLGLFGKSVLDEALLKRDGLAEDSLMGMRPTDIALLGVVGVYVCMHVCMYGSMQCRKRM